jgi:tetratricopeptide (TPR) repeat protein
VQDFDIAFKIEPKTAKEYFHYFEQALIDIQSQHQYRVENNIEQSVDDLINKALNLSNTGDNKKAIQYLNLALEIEPVNATAYNNRGYCFYLLEDFHKALKDYNIALRIEPKFFIH